MAKNQNNQSEKGKTENTSTELVESSLKDSTDNVNQSQPSSAQNPSSRSKLVEKYGRLGLIGIIATILGLILAIYALYPFKSEPTPPPPIVQKKYTVLVPLASNGSEYRAFMQIKEGTYEEKYNNQASQNIRDIVKVAKARWFKDHQGRNLQEADIDFFCFPEGFTEDKESFEKSFNHAVEIVKRQGREIVGLLGNVSSTSTETYGKFCSKNYKPEVNNTSINQNANGNTNNNQSVNSNINNDQNDNNDNGKKTEVENYGIPMFLPLATATSLIKNLDLISVPAVLRLPPANDKQAENISAFLLDKGIYKTVILKDLTNETYSSDLIENFRQSYVQKHLSGGTTNFGEIVGTIPISGKETSPFLYSVLSGKGTGLVIAGMTNSAIETLAQAKASNSNFNAIILTDGAVDEYLGKRIKKIRTEDDLKNLYLSFPSPCSLDIALEKYIGDEPTLKSADFKFTHALFVADGVYIIISELNDKIIQAGNKPGNKILIDFINGLKEKAEKSENDWKKKNPDKPENPASKSVSVGINLPFTDVSHRDYLIDKFGNNTNASYFLFKLDANSDWQPVDDKQPARNCSSSK